MCLFICLFIRRYVSELSVFEINYRDNHKLCNCYNFQLLKYIPSTNSARVYRADLIDGI